MNREIKFRVWDPVYLTWRYPIWYMGSNLNANQQGYIVQQYTGLKDKNGKEIYEGDIIKATRKWNFHCSKGDVFVVEFNVETVSYGLLPDGCVVRPSHENFADLTKKKSLQCEVIGNIFENPELLVEKEYDNTL